MTDIIIGLDVGTTSVKAVAYDPTWETHAAAAFTYHLIRPAADRVEQDPEELWQGVLAVLREVAGKLSPEDRVLAIGISSQGGTTIPVDQNARPLYNAINWMDQRAIQEKERVMEGKFGENEVYFRSGWRLMPGLPLLHIKWLRNYFPDLFTPALKINFVNDYILSRLTGVSMMDPSSASITQLTDIHSGDWDAELVDLAGIKNEQLSPIQPSGVVIGKILPSVAHLVHLPEEVVLVNGAHDQYCSACAVGVVRPGLTMLSCGTAWILLVIPEKLNASIFNGMGISRHAVEGLIGGIYSMGGMGRNIEWFIDQIIGKNKSTTLTEKELFGQFDALVASVKNPESCPFFTPLIGGEWGGKTGEGGFWGINISHTTGDLARAVLEGSVFELQKIIDNIRNLGVNVGELIMVGGASRSPFLPQMVASITGCPVILPGINETACRGAALCAAKGIGWISSYESYITKANIHNDRYLPEKSSMVQDRSQEYYLMKKKLFGG